MAPSEMETSTAVEVVQKATDRKMDAAVAHDALRRDEADVTMELVAMNANGDGDDGCDGDDGGRCYCCHCLNRSHGDGGGGYGHEAVTSVASEVVAAIGVAFGAVDVLREWSTVSDPDCECLRPKAAEHDAASSEIADGVMNAVKYAAMQTEE